MDDTEANARLLISEIKTALRNGVKHYNKSGQPLNTEREIIDALLKDGRISFTAAPPKPAE